MAHASRLFLLVLLTALIPHFTAMAADAPTGVFLTKGPLTSPAIVKGRFLNAGRLTGIYVRISGAAYAKKILLGSAGGWSFQTGKLVANGNVATPRYTVTGFRGKQAIVSVSATYRLLPAVK